MLPPPVNTLNNTVEKLPTSEDIGCAALRDTSARRGHSCARQHAGEGSNERRRRHRMAVNASTRAELSTHKLWKTGWAFHKVILTRVGRRVRFTFHVKSSCSCHTPLASVLRLLACSVSQSHTCHHSPHIPSHESRHTQASKGLYHVPMYSGSNPSSFDFVIIATAVLRPY